MLFRSCNQNAFGAESSQEMAIVSLILCLGFLPLPAVILASWHAQCQSNVRERHEMRRGGNQKSPKLHLSKACEI